MEDMNIEEFHQYLLFHLLDADIHPRAEYIAIDEDGEIYSYFRQPYPCEIAPSSMEEPEGQWRCDKGRDIDPVRVNGLQARITIPSNLTWRDCVWKI